MRARGINYDTGTFSGHLLTRKTFDPEQVRHGMTAIADNLYCDAVRISGGDAERLSIAARHAADAGLEVWFSPFPADLAPGQILPFLADCAQRAEVLRQDGAQVVFVAGCELSAFAHGFLPGNTYLDRLHAMATADIQWWTSLGPVPERLNTFLAQAATTVRAHFGGRITYASGPWEPIDWGPFDLVGIDAYRTAQNADTFRIAGPVMAREVGEVVGVDVSVKAKLEPLRSKLVGLVDRGWLRKLPDGRFTTRP
ncbi:hypothetical protein [Streptomyces sp. NPDC002403]